MFILLRLINLLFLILICAVKGVNDAGCCGLQRLKDIGKDLVIWRRKGECNSTVYICIFPLFPPGGTQNEINWFLLKLCFCSLAFFFVVIVFLLFKIKFGDYRHVGFRYRKLHKKIKKLNQEERKWVKKVQLSESKLRDVNLDLIKLEYHKCVIESQDKDKKGTNYITGINLTLKEYYEKKEKYKKELAKEEKILFEILSKSSGVKQEMDEIQAEIHKVKKKQKKQKK